MIMSVGDTQFDDDLVTPSLRSLMIMMDYDGI